MTHHERSRRALRWWLALGVVGLLWSPWVCAASASDTDACAGRHTSVLIDLHQSRLYLCKGDQVVGRYAIAYGRGGMDKRKQGDKKTPLGTYRLGKPRASKAFGTFIHVGYPTRAQRAKGMTGSAIGIHGPHRNLVWAGRLNTLINATDGCVMVTEEDIQAIAAWVRLKRARKVHIEPRLGGS